MQKLERKKYFFFYGSDLISPKENLELVIRDGFTAFPLDASAVGFALEYQLDFKVVDDFISMSEIEGLREQSEYISDTWFRKFHNQFSSTGVCWPDIDQMALYWCWNDRLIILKLLEKLNEQGVVFAVANLKKHVPRPAVFAYPTGRTSIADGIKLLIKEVGGDLTVCYDFVKRTRPKRKDSLQGLKQRARKGLQLLLSHFSIDKKNDHSGTDALKVIGEKILFITLEDDFYRASHLIEEIKNCWSNKLVLFPIYLMNTVVKNTSEEIKKKTNLDVVSAIPLLKVNKTLGAKFFECYEMSVDAADDLTKAVTRNLQFQFKYYCYERWPQLDAQYRYFIEVFQRHRPKAVLVSNLDSAETQLPAMAANTLNIPTFAIPHGGVGRCKLNLQHAKTIFFGSDLIRANSLRNSRIPADAMKKKDLVIAQGMITERNNSVSAAKINYDSTKLRVLILTSTIGVNELILPFVLPATQILTLKSIAKIPSSMSQKVQLLIRPRPGNLDLRMYQNIGLGNMLISSETSLEENILNCDVVVALNNYQTSLSHAVELHKPIIQFVSDTTLLTWKMMSYSDSYRELGPVIRRTEDLWTILRDITDNRAILEMMKKRTSDFYSKYWETAGYPSVTEVISRDVTF